MTNHVAIALGMNRQTPLDFDPRTICLSVDVEWAHPAIVADLQALLDERGLKATFFVTHDNVLVPGHERGIHPNFRRNGDALKALRTRLGDAATTLDETAIYEHVIRMFKGFAPDARGVRGHSLYYDSLLLPIYERYGLEFDSSYQMPLVPRLVPFWKEYGIVEIPIYLNDFFELRTGAIGFNAGKLDFAAPGLKVFNMHPNTVFLNAASLDHYESTKGFYHDVDRLLAARHSGHGIRTMVIDTLDRIASQDCPILTLGEVNALWHSQADAQLS